MKEEILKDFEKEFQELIFSEHKNRLKKISRWRWKLGNVPKNFRYLFFGDSIAEKYFSSQVMAICAVLY
jgi:hypothetical protein